ncbi:hypothetical protein HYU11_03130 [Candidatus Woesearchaeota archaeon]|nr:hypothetical protein [Candidatus Woesearchaeota archaeon]
MRSVVFDAGPVISLTMNNLLWLLEPLKKRFSGEFYISEPVMNELVDRPLTIKRFEFEALQVRGEIDCGIIKIAEDERIRKMAEEMLTLANSTFSAKGTGVNIVHIGEMSTLALSKIMDSEAAFIDERTTRDLIENPRRIAHHMQSKLHTKVKVNEGCLEEFSKMAKGIRVLRSVELVAVAYELGLIDKYVDRCKNPSPELKARLLDSVLWGVKLDGCAVSEKEIDQMKKLILN